MAMSYLYASTAQFLDMPLDIKRYMSFIPRTIIFSAVVDGDPTLDSSTNGLVAIRYTSGSGDYTDILPGMSLDIGTTMGASDIRRGIRIRKKPATNQRIYVEEIAPSLVPLTNGLYLSVVEEYLPHRILPFFELTGSGAAFTDAFTEYMDYDIAYSTPEAALPPKANITQLSGETPFPAGFLDAGETYRTMSLTALTSAARFPGATIVSYLWEIINGTLSFGTTTDHTITVQWNAGFRYLRLTVTDSNGVTGTRVLPVWAHSPTDGLDEYLLTGPLPRRHNQSVFKGSELSLEIYESYTHELDNILDTRATVCYWEKVTNASGTDITKAPQFLGYISNIDRVHKLYEPTWTFTVKDTCGWLDIFQGFEQTFIRTEDEAEPDKWYLFEDLRPHLAIAFLLEYYSTLNLISNNWLPVDSSYPIYKESGVGRTSLFQQFNDLAGSILSQFASNATGDMELSRDCDHLYTAGEREARGGYIHLDPSCYYYERNFTRSQDLTEKVGGVVCGGSFYDVSVEDEHSRLLQSKAPGKAPRHGKAYIEGPFIRCPSEGGQTYLNKASGVIWQQMINPEQDLQLVLFPGLDIFDLRMNKFLALTVAIPDNAGGETLTEVLFKITAISVRHNSDPARSPKEVTLTISRAITDPIVGEYVHVPENGLDVDDGSPDDGDFPDSDGDTPPTISPGGYPYIGTISTNG